jgi:TatD DNase family protein
VIDIAVNLLHQRFAADREEVLQRATAAGVASMLITSTDLNATEKAIAYCELHDMFCTAGIHPHDANGAAEKYVDELTLLAQSDRVKAIGETGLDFNRNFSPPATQRDIFSQQLRLACELQKPVFVHDRDSNGEVYDQLHEFDKELNGVVIHCFTGTRTDLHRYLEAGYFIGITGWVCDVRRGEELRSMIPDIPLEQLLVETDAPFLKPHTVPADWQANLSRRNSKRNEPALLCYVIAQIAQLHECEPNTIAAITTRNALTLFDLPEPG